MIFLWITVVILNIVSYIVPKRITKVDMYVTPLLAMLLFCLSDIYLDAKLQFYWYFTKDIEWRWLILLFGGIPSSVILFLNYLPFHATVFKRILYIVSTSLLFTLLEWSAVHIGEILYYNKWSIVYSALLYPFLLLLLYFNCLWVRKWTI